MRRSVARPSHRAATALCLAAGCTAGLTQPDRIVYGARPSVIDPGPGGIGTVTVADSVRAGAVVAVVIPTAGGGCVRQGETRVTQVSDLVVEVQPFDSVPVRMAANVACTDEFRVLAHAAEVRFGRAGTATLRVRGRSADYQGGREVVLEHSVVVR